MGLKLSIFNSIVKENNNCIIYNSLTGGVLGLDEKYTKLFENLITNDTNSNEEKELIKNLICAKMLVPEELDEEDLLAVKSNLDRFGSKDLYLTIAPTLECNFCCPYCYEKGRKYNTMNEIVINKLLEYIKNNCQSGERLNIAWYGGEPLLAFDIIKQISLKIEQLKIPYTAAIVTNGYLLTADIALELKKLHIQKIQVTIDGIEMVHNSRRILKDGTGTFKQILENISSVCSIIPITIRVNVDKENIKDLDSLLNQLDNYSLSGKVGLYIAPVDNINHTCNDTNCFTSEEFAIEQIKFYHRNIYRGYFFAQIPYCNTGICGAVNARSAIVDPLGDLYRCWDDVGDLNEKTGSIFDNNMITPNNIKWLSYEPCKGKKCDGCNIKPICMGGCPNKVLKKGLNTCHPLKYNLEEFIKMKRDTFNSSESTS